MNKKQSIASVLGFTLIVLTWLYGNGQFQAYKETGGFGSSRIAVVEQRIKPKILVSTIIAEAVGTGMLFYLLKESKSKK